MTKKYEEIISRKRTLHWKQIRVSLAQKLDNTAINCSKLYKLNKK